MKVPPANRDQSGAPGLSRRHFLAEAGSAALALSVVGPDVARGASAKVDLGIIGCGGRGSWIADLFQKFLPLAWVQLQALLDKEPELAVRKFHLIPTCGRGADSGRFRVRPYPSRGCGRP